MAWTESTSASFACRHSSERAADAARVLRLLEATAERLSEHFQRLEDELTVVLHDSPHALVLSNPLLPAIWALSSRRARRYVTGWAGRHELHMLSPPALRERATNTSGSFEMLALAPASLYAKRVLVGSNRELQSARLPARSWAELRWAWLVEGASRWLSGESGHSRAVVGQYMRAGRRPRFPPGPRDAPLLAPSLIELLAEQEGQGGVARLAGRLHTGGADAALRHAFPGRGLASIESEWRSRLRRLGEGG
ncbi:MAG TPA: hypothetical protein VG293_01650 [Solirubrobacteraceae bacterium]|jgi:hypothetical protein|nr:hypothetical protein [Solirubrobacteraceae bacterium]